jgi:hypothetical protein
MFWIFETRNTLYITLTLIVMISGANYSIFPVESAFSRRAFPVALLMPKQSGEGESGDRERKLLWNRRRLEPP